MNSPDLDVELVLRPPEHRVERRAIGWWMLQAVITFGAVVVATGVAYLWWDAARPWLIVAVIASVVLLVVGVAIEPFWRYRVHRWGVMQL